MSGNNMNGVTNSTIDLQYVRQQYTTPIDVDAITCVSIVVVNDE